MAGIRGFEPLNDGIKTRCLTAWLYPYNVFTCATMLLFHQIAGHILNSHIYRICKPAITKAYQNFMGKVYLISQLIFTGEEKMVATPGLEPGTPSL